MNKKSFFILLSLVIATSLMLLSVFSLGADTSAVTAAAQTWYGAWQPGPDLDGALVGCAANDGFARHSGVYDSTTKRVYFLGGRCENDATSGVVFYFDMASRTYVDTGVTMQIPVSNYQAVVVPNDGSGNGRGFYIVGGRTTTGVNTSAVQVYYPNTNTTDVIESDPLPPTGNPRALGGMAYVNGKIYAFGGFNGANMDNQTYTYDPTATEGERWENIHKPLPTDRSYIATVVVGDLIYAIGGDEFDGAGLVPLDDTLVLDTNNIGPGWVDGAMADLPVANGDAPAVYIPPGGYLGGDGGGIFVIGGYWPSPGPYRWVYRYDIDTDTWDSFPSLAIPEPATGRRNQAAVYVPPPGPTGITGLDDGESGIWTFGGFDGSGTNAMTSSSEFLSIEDKDMLVLPEAVEVISMPGETAIHNFVALNLSGIEDEIYDLSFTSDEPTWTTTLPDTVGPVPDGDAGAFIMEVSIPSDASCPETGEFTVTATSQSNAAITDSQEVTVVASCGVSGVVTDATTGEPIENAYVWIQNSPDGLDEYYDAYTDVDGAYLINKLSTGTYYMGASANKRQPSFYPDGWPEGAVVVELAGTAAMVDLDLVSSRLEWSPGSFDVTADAGTLTEETLTISNTGTGPLYYFFNVMDGMQPEPPPAAELPVAGLPRIDPLLLSKLEVAEDGKADFVVVLKSQANLQAAYAIADWQERGEYVYNTLSNHAEQNQKGVRNMLQNNGASFQPLYVINAIIVRGGNIGLVNSLAARPDVAQIIANRSIAVEDPQPSAVTAPTAIEWNIDRVNADDVWNEYSVFGEGIVVAEIDTGTEWDHPALINQYRGWDGTTADHNYNWYDPYGQSPDVPSDTHGHGTHVMGTMVGDDGLGNQIGMAPAAQWISCKGGDNVSGYLLTDELLQCAEWIVAPTDLEGNNPDPSMRPHVVNNSWGGGSGDYWFTGVIDAWRAAGVFPQFSNGNEGPSCSTAGSPGDTWNAFSAGASDVNDAIASFSSRGPSVNFGYLKPDITAPGVDIRSSIPGGGYEAGWSGTSMASPHVAGAIALLWSANPELVGQIDLSGWLLQQSATPMYTTEGCGGDLADTHPNNTWGWGLLNVYAAVQMAEGASPAWLSVAPLAGEVAPGESQPIALNFEPAVDQSGLYTATLWLVADDPVNSDVRMPISMTVVVNPPVADFVSNSPISLGETAIFTNTTSGARPMTFLWDFGDGITSTLEHPTHFYQTIGTFDVTLTATNDLGEDTVSYEFVVTEVPPEDYLDIYLPLVMKELSPE